MLRENIRNFDALESPNSSPTIFGGDSSMSKEIARGVRLLRCGIKLYVIICLNTNIQHVL